MKNLIYCVLALIVGILIGGVIGTYQQDDYFPGAEAQVPIRDVGSFIFYAGEVFVVTWANFDETSYTIVRVLKPAKVER